jgi:PAS domain-containing protein
VDREQPAGVGAVVGVPGLDDDLVEGLLAVDPQNTIVSANAAAHRILERRTGTLVGGSAMEAFLDHRVEDLVAAARRTGFAAGDLPPRISDGR